MSDTYDDSTIGAEEWAQHFGASVDNTVKVIGGGLLLREHHILLETEKPVLMVGSPSSYFANVYL